MERLLILRLGSMGDIIHTLPAAAALRRAFPDAILGWAVEERWAELLCAPGAGGAPAGSLQKPLVDGLHFINTVAWRAALFSGETWKEASAALAALRAAQYEAVVDFQGAWKSAAIAWWSGARRIGFEQPRESPATLFYDRRVLALSTHVAQQNLELASAVTGRQETAMSFPLPCDPAAEAWREQELRRRGIAEYALLSPGAGWGAKVWSLQSYGEVARALAAGGLPALVNFGPGEEALARAVQQASDGAAQPVRCSLGELIALARRARLCIGGDSGPLHLAAALGVPVVGIYGPTDPARNGPVGSAAIVLRSPESATSYAHHDRTDAGLLSILTGEVMAAARRLLEGTHG